MRPYTILHYRLFQIGAPKDRPCTVKQHSTFRQTDLKNSLPPNQALAQVESLSELLPVLLEFARDVTQAMGASILLYKPESKTLEFTLAINEQQGAAEEIISKKFELSLGEGIAGYVAETRESLLVADTQEDTRFSRKG